MKKIVSLALAAVMLLGVVPMVNAAEVTDNHDYSNGTAITLVGTGTEEYTVTVPAKMAPGDTGTVKAEGTWAADKYLNVQAPEYIILSHGSQSMAVEILFGANDGFSLIGNSVDPVSKEVEISVEDASRLFGTWEGILEYSVSLVHKGDVNQDGVITDADVTALREIESNLETVTEEMLAYCDVNNNGEIASTEHVSLSRVLNGAAVTLGGTKINIVYHFPNGDAVSNSAFSVPTGTTWGEIALVDEIVASADFTITDDGYVQVNGCYLLDESGNRVNAADAPIDKHDYTYEK